MRNKLYLVFAVLCVVTIYLVSAEETPRQADSALDFKKSVSTKDKKESRDKTTKTTKAESYDSWVDDDKYPHEDDEDEVDDSHIPRSSFDYQRYTPHGSRDGNYRTRSRWSGSSGSGSGSGSALPSSSSSQAFTQSLSQMIPSLFDTTITEDNDWNSNGYENTFNGPSSYDAPDVNTMSNKGPSCNSLIDAQYPIFSDVCGAVPQAKYSLPNAFGHRERWQVAQILTAVMSSTTEATCTRSLRLLLCPMLFPSCSSARNQAPAVLPCQSYCRAVKSQCPSTILNTLPCEVLPYTSDLCPNPQSYGSYGLTGGFDSGNQGSSVNGGFSRSRASSLQSLLSSPAFQALLAQHGFQTGAGSQGYQGTFPAQTVQHTAPQQNYQTTLGGQGQGYQSGFGQQNYQSTYPAQNYQGGAPFTQQNFPSAFGQQNTQTTYPAQNYQPALTQQTFPTAHIAQPVTTPAPVLATPAPMPRQTPTPFNSFNNGGFGNDNFNSMSSDYQSRLYSNDYQPSPRYPQSTETRSSINTRPASGSSIVKA